jgi:HEAT repeat protein
MNRCVIMRAILVVVLSVTPALSDDRPGSTIEALKSRDLDARRAAANQLQDSDRDRQREALPTLIDLLMSEKDGQVRLAVFNVITSLGPDAAPAVPALVQTLRTSYGGQGQEESHQDYRSALALAAIGKPAVEGLRGLLKERKEAVRAEVAMGLGRIGPDAAPAIPDLMALLGDGSARVRREASEALGRIGPSAIEPLIEAAKSQNIIIREGAAEGLGTLAEPDDRARRTLLESTHDDAPEVRAAAIRSLAKLKLPDEVVLPIVRENLRHLDDRVRLAVVALLVEARTLLLAIGPDLESLLTSGSDGVARQAAFLLGKSGPVAAPRLLNALRREGSRGDSIAEALALIGRPAVGLLLRSLDDSDPRVRRGAALALGQLRPLAPGTVETLTAGLTDPIPQVRMAFLTAIGQLGPRAAGSVPAIRLLLRDGSPELRGRAIETLFQAAPRDDRMLDDLASLIDDPDPRVRRQAIDALRNLGPPGRKVLAVVIDRLACDDPEVRFAAAQFVESHGMAAVEAIPALSRLLDDPSPKIRTIAATTLGRFGKESRPAFPALARLVEDEDGAVREAATSALGSLELDAETVRPSLARALRDDKAEVRRAAVRAIPRLGPAGSILIPDILLMAARKENLRTVDRLLRPFEASGPDVRSLPELVKQLDHDQVAVRLLAIKFLGLAGRQAREALPALERISNDPDAEVRKQAKAACERIKLGPESARPKDQPGPPAP